MATKQMVITKNTTKTKTRKQSNSNKTIKCPNCGSAIKTS